ADKNLEHQHGLVRGQRRTDKGRENSSRSLQGVPSSHVLPGVDNSNGRSQHSHCGSFARTKTKRSPQQTQNDEIRKIVRDLTAEPSSKTYFSDRCGYPGESDEFEQTWFRIIPHRHPEPKIDGRRQNQHSYRVSKPPREPRGSINGPRNYPCRP